MNPQVAFGDDVIARLHHVTHDPDGLARAAADGGRRGQQPGREGRGAERRRARRHPRRGDGRATPPCTTCSWASIRATWAWRPSSPAVQSAVDTRASAIGLTFHPGCRLHVLPVEAGFVGADNVGVLIAEEPYNQDEVLLIIDIGTNGELVLGNRQRMLSTSCATGPALEGSHIEFGMRAAPGAIERIRIEPDTFDVRFKVIGLEDWHTSYPADEVGARGICGSGIIEAAAEMLKAGVILPNGNLDPELRARAGDPGGRQAAQVRDRLAGGDGHRSSHHRVAQGHPGHPAGQGRPAGRSRDPAAHLRGREARPGHPGRRLRHLHRQAPRAGHRDAARLSSRKR